jgi:S-adenosylmethionine:tRNA ribosyltransferase-isomerase
VRTADFHFELPPELIAQYPANRRDQSRLLVLHRAANRIEHRCFPDLLGFLQPGDVLVLNDSRVIPARLRGANAKTDGKFEVLLLEENAVNDWWAMAKPGKRAPIGTRIKVLDHDGLPTTVMAEVVGVNAEGHRRLAFSGTANLFDDLERLGEIPLPPYIGRADDGTTDRERYQTVFAQAAGSVAAPTAGLHFTPELLQNIRALGVKIGFVTLHVGLGTFAPVKAENISDHTMHEERIEIGPETAALVNQAKAAGRRVVAIGTTSVRVLETIAQQNDGAVNVYKGKTRIFIFPPFRFKIVDALLTNFHLPGSTLLMLASSFVAPGEKSGGRKKLLAAYTEAIREQYRFFSYGDAMLIL